MALAHAEAHRWSRDEYYRMAEFGVLGPGERVELIDGEVVALSPQDKQHAVAITRGTAALVRALADRFYVRVQLPLDLGEFHQPEPDFAIVLLEALEAAERHPTHAALVIEVAFSSLAYDRDEKASLYARAGIPEYWIVNLPMRRLEVHRGPAPQPDRVFGHGYTTMSFHAEHQPVHPLLAPDVTLHPEDLM